jgi:hypothetical protein
MNSEDLKGNELQPGPTLRESGRCAVFTCSGAVRVKAKREAKVA